LATQQLKTLQEALNNLVKGKHEVILNPTFGKVLPTVISHIALNNKKSTFETLLSQFSIAIQTTDPNLKVAAVSCLISTAKLLVDGAHWNQLIKMAPTLKLIAEKQEFTERTRSEARKIIRDLEVVITSDKRKKTVKPSQEKDPVTTDEEQIFKIAESGESERAKKKLFNLVVSCAKKRDFFNADRLRDRIYEIDSMAVTEIIQLNEIIDTEKNRSIGKHDLLKWTVLREKMTEDEFSKLFYSMEIKSFKPGTTLVSKGEQNDGLYFINMGVVSVSYGEGKKAGILKTLETGDIFGENFFDSSYWTVSLNALELTKVIVLKRKIFDELEKIIPELESILKAFYEDANNIKQLIQLKKIERRKHERYTIERGIQVQVAGNKDRKPTHFKAELKDISQGGLSFGVRITNRKNSRLLFSRGTKISIPLAAGNTNKFLSGTIIGVQLKDSITCDCSVHVKFIKKLEYEAFKLFLY